MYDVNRDLEEQLYELKISDDKSLGYVLSEYYTLFNNERKQSTDMSKESIKKIIDFMTNAIRRRVEHVCGIKNFD